MFLRNAAMLDTFGVTVTATESSDVYGAADTDIKANAKSYDVIIGNAYTTAAPRIRKKNRTLSGGVIKRTEHIEKDGSTVNIAIMTFVREVYDNFELSVDYKAGAQTQFWPVIGIRRQIPGKYYLTDGGGAGVFMQQSGLITMWGPIIKGNKDGHLYEDKIPGSSDYAPRQWHNMRIYADGTDVTVYIDDTEVLKTQVKCTDYEKGYISLISVNNDCEFDNFKIRSLGSSSKQENEPNRSKYADMGQSLDDIIKNGYSKEKATVK